MRSLSDLKVSGKRVLLRVDFNVPLAEGSIADDMRISKSIPTIQALIEQKAKQIILISHLGRPEGKRVEGLSLAPLVARVSELLGEKVAFVKDCVDVKLPNDRVVLLENLRFHPGEEANDPAFAQKLASLADCFVNNAFATAHRSHASTVGIPALLPSAPGLLMEHELTFLNLNNKKHPLMVIFGARKIEDKVPLLQHFLKVADTVFLGGAVVFTFMKAQGYAIGASMFERDLFPIVREISEEKGEMLIFPRDFVVATSPTEGIETKIVEFHKIPPTMKGLDLGPKSVKLFIKRLEEAKTVFWNGPLGVAEMEAFSNATREVAKYLASRDDLVTIAGGGDTAAALHNMGLADKFTHVSTGGGAALKLLAGEELPAIVALEKST